MGVAQAAMTPPVVPGGLPPATSGVQPLLRGTDTLAVASAICGFTAIVPVVSQVVGLVLGVVSLVRIGRARRRGVALRGVGWAWAGIVSSGFVMLSWIAVLGLLLAVKASLLHTVNALPSGTLPGG